VKLNPAKNSKTIDITDADGSYKGKTLLGIYALKGDGVLRASRQSATSEVRHGNRNEPVLPCLEAREGLGQVTLSNYKIGTCEP
jgi:hypothetical protein